MCRAPKQFKPYRFAPRVKSETEQAYHKIYLVYVYQLNGLNMQMQT